MLVLEKRYSPTVELRPVDANNWYDCSELEVTEEQRGVFPVSIVYWLAESAYCGFTPLAVYASEELVGFAAYAVDPDDGSYWIMAFMIDGDHQGRGFGRAGMKELIRLIRETHGCDRIRLGHRPGNEAAARLYASLGFEEVDADDREIIRELRF